MGGGMNDYHRQARKKEIKKNKEKRVAERDARVVQLKTAADVQEDIKKLTKQHKDKDKEGNEVKLPHAIQSKLDRLKKELKLLEAAAEEKGDQEKPFKKAAVPTWTPLAHPQLSVYFDATLNPYGEPPPGQPRMYHTREGGTTCRLEEAALPGSRPPPPPPPREAWRRPNDNENQREGDRSRPPPHRPVERRPPPPPPLPPTPPPPAKSSKGGSSSHTNKPPAAVVAKKMPPTTAPSLPPPSQAVRRGRARLDADIWATSDEIDYHQARDLVLEGVDNTAAQQQNPKKDTAFTEWWYEDRMQQVQGPFAHAQMLAWMGAGFFTTTVRARPRPTAPWKPVLHYAVFRKVLQGEDPVEKKDPVKDRIAALRQEAPQEMSVADRIAALRGDAPEDIPEAPQEMSMADRIAALRGDAPENDPVQEEDTPDDDGFDEDMLPPPPPPVESSDYLPPYEMSDEGADDEMPPPPPPPSANNDHLDEPAPYAIDMSLDNIPPPPPPLASEPYDVPAYAIDDISPYDTDHAVGEYPVDMAYPVEDDTPVTDGYPVVDSYPTTEPEPEAAPPPPKRIKVDREVVSFLPSNLQKRKK
jgi:hypothetical protein